MEKCENCGTGIGELETPYLWDGRVVCRVCLERLQAKSGGGNEIPNNPPVNSSHGDSKFNLKDVIGLAVICVVLGVIFFAGWWVYHAATAAEREAIEIERRTEEQRAKFSLKLKEDVERADADLKEAQRQELLEAIRSHR